MRTGSRAGTALVIALVLLVALLLLGLPFLFTQSASLTGTRSYADARMAQIGRDNAANIAAAAAAYAMTPALAMPGAPGQTSEQWSSLARDFMSPWVGASALKPSPVLSSAVLPTGGGDGGPQNPDSGISIQPARSPQMGVGITPSIPTPGQPAQTTLLNARITDESGKLDPNDMSPVAWSNLFAAADVHITDWNYQNSLPASIAPYLDPNTRSGQLAQALAHLRGKLPGRRITDLEQLLLANPQDEPLYWGGVVSQLRWPLTRAELERLKPYLTLHNPRPGRMGLIDLGSVLAVDPIRDDTIIDCPIDPLVGPLTAFAPAHANDPGWARLPNQRRLLGNGTVLLAEGALGGSVAASGSWAMVDDAGYLGEMNGSTHLLMGEPLFVPGGTFLNPTGAALGQGATTIGSAIMVEAPAPLNAHVIAAAVRSALQYQPGTANPIGRPYDDNPTAAQDDGIVSSVGSPLMQDGTPSNAWISSTTSGLANARMRVNGTESPWPLFLNTAAIIDGDERPPLGILSAGTFAIDSDATVTDVLGRPSAQASRRDIVQALPQELLLERRWRTQGALHQLVYGRFANLMQAWPVPYERLATDATTGMYQAGPNGQNATPPGHPVAPDDVDPVPSAATVQGAGGNATPGMPAPGTGLRERPLEDLATAPMPYANQPTDQQRLAHCLIDWRVPFGANTFNTLNAGDAALQAETIPLQYQATGAGPTQAGTWALAPSAVQNTVATAPNGVNAMPQCVEIQQSSGTLSALDANLLVDLQPDGFHSAPEGANYQPLGYFLAPLPFANLPVSPMSAQQTVGVATGFVVERPDTGVESTSLAIQGIHEMDARHLSLWIKPTSDWTSGIVPIFELRAPNDTISPMTYDVSANGDLATANAPGSNGAQNYLGLAYDANAGLLVLAIAPPSIAHVVDSLWQVPGQDPSNQLVDTSTLGPQSEPGVTLKPLAPASYADAGAGLQSITPLFEPNRILHLYQIPLGNGPAFFHANVWHHIELAIASDRPQDAAIIVDGVVGQDITKTPPPATPTMQYFGDHCTLPSLPLAAPIAQTTIANGDPLAANGPALPASGIQVMPLTIAGKTLTAINLFPARGMVRIDDEYFLYDGISPDGKTLLGFKGATSYGPMRGRRQDTNTAFAPPTPPNPDWRYPETQGHAADALVVPGGYRVLASSSPGGQLYPGGSTLQVPMPPGDATSGNRIWATIDYTKTPVVNVTGTTYAWQYTQGGTLPLSNAAGSPASFIGPGVVMIVDRTGVASYWYFQQNTGGVLTNVQALDAFPKVSDGSVNATLPKAIPYSYSGTNYGIAVPFDLTNGNQGAMVYLASIYATGTPWTTYDSRGSSWNPGEGQDIVGLLMPASAADAGHVEWLTYNTIVTNNVDPSAGGFFVSTTAFNSPNPLSGRGVQRTAMTPAPFPAGAKILPVQTELGQCGHWIATGDVVTVIGHATPARSIPSNVAAVPNPIATDYAAFAATATTPYPAVQMTVRYGATDGYQVNPPAAAGTYNDSKNEYFCFSDALPPAFQAAGPIPYANLEIISGDCWSGDDLSPDVALGGNRMVQPRGYLPRLDLWNDPAASATPANADAAVFFGSLDPRPNRAVADTWAMQHCFNSYGSYQSGTAGGGANPINNVDNVDCVIDGICAGPLSPAVNAGNTTLMQDDGHDLGPINSTPSSIDYLFQGGNIVTVIPNDATWVGMVVHASAPIFPYGTCGNMGLVQIDGEVFAYQVPTPADQAMVNGVVSGISWNNPQQLSTYARLVGRGLLGSAWAVHTIGVGPVLSDASQHNARLCAVRLPLGPVLQLQTSIAFDPTTQVANWFTLSDQDASANQPSALYAPAALLCTSDGKTMEMMGMVGPLTHHNYGSPNPYPNQFANQGQYTSASWLRGLYNTQANTAPGWTTQPGGQTYPPLVIGWWPRFASAYPASGQATLTAQQLRSRFYAWFGLPVPAYGAFFDTTRRDTFFPNTPLAEMQCDDLGKYFQIEARALSYQDRWSGPSAVAGQGSMDWSLQDAVQVPSDDGSALVDLSDVFSDAKDVARCFNATVNGSRQGLAVDGAEVRISWRYSTGPQPQDPTSPAKIAAAWQALGQACGSSPAFSNADVRYLAPVRVLATERSR